MKVQDKIKPMPKMTAITLHRETNVKFHIFLSQAVEFEWLTLCSGHLRGNYCVLPTGNYEALKGGTFLPVTKLRSKQHLLRIRYLAS